ncbi:uncharacterized protein PGTG_14697 [Puccinia graminis f. sp. tritici CRL 75-36-700-3]|uniref:Uncharacterized protein n=1 Tax=Puccinia graminis f. sp. tritici (strain CRL 75-36-700-3 / race SCCL) TaxID=418459 RepID=E3KWR4_PUCGT|nr:uncharacterized protein PGTG_14697 [Puccinia graminis f. sp. tritici CRL 75-36-700-3]EFP88731.1 hypothetical protein PGTG_14697 [Puccinia graminis f. sp. tritici CRL 75-36-700-3]
MATNLFYAPEETRAPGTYNLNNHTGQTSYTIPTVHFCELTQQPIGPELMVVTGRSRQGGESHASELSQYLKERAGDKLGEPVDLAHRLGIVASSDVRKSLGDVSSALVASQMEGRILVIQARSADFDHNKQRIDDLEKSE